jgi:hypothetical protein
MFALPAPIQTLAPAQNLKVATRDRSFALYLGPDVYEI